MTSQTKTPKKAKQFIKGGVNFQPKKVNPLNLSENQQNILTYLSQGLTQKQIADKLNISKPAVCKTVKKLYAKGVNFSKDTKNPVNPSPNHKNDNNKHNKFQNEVNSLGGGLVNPPRPPLPLTSLGNAKKEILQCLSQGGNPHNIAKKTNKHRSTIQQHLRELNTLGLVSKDSFLWGLTKQGIDFLGGGLTLVGCERGGRVVVNQWLHDRAHNIKIKIAVTKTPPNNLWLMDWNTNKKIKNNVFYSKSFGDVLTTYTGKSFIFQLPVLRFKDSEMAVAEAGRVAHALIKQYEYDIPGLKLGGFPDIKAQLITQHHAVPNDPYAKFCLKHGITYRDELIDIDASEKGTPEIEFTDSQNSHIHHQRYIEHQKDILLNNSAKPSELTEYVKAIAISQATTNNQLNTFIRMLTPQLPPLKIQKSETVSYIG